MHGVRARLEHVRDRDHKDARITAFDLGLAKLDIDAMRRGQGDAGESRVDALVEFELDFGQ